MHYVQRRDKLTLAEPLRTEHRWHMQDGHGSGRRRQPFVRLILLLECVSIISMTMLDTSCLSDILPQLKFVLAGMRGIAQEKIPPILVRDSSFLGLLNQDHFLTIDPYRHGTIFQFGTLSWNDKHMQTEFFLSAKSRRNLWLDYVANSGSVGLVLQRACRKVLRIPGSPANVHLLPLVILHPFQRSHAL